MSKFVAYCMSSEQIVSCPSSSRRSPAWLWLSGLLAKEGACSRKIGRLLCVGTGYSWAPVAWGLGPSPRIGGRT